MAQRHEVRTDLFKLVFNSEGGSLIGAQILRGRGGTVEQVGDGKAEAGLIGVGLLSQTRWAVDIGQSRLWLVPGDARERRLVA